MRVLKRSAPRTRSSRIPRRGRGTTHTGTRTSTRTRGNGWRRRRTRGCSTAPRWGCPKRSCASCGARSRSSSPGREGTSAWTSSPSTPGIGGCRGRRRCASTSASRPVGGTGARFDSARWEPTACSRWCSSSGSCDIPTFRDRGTRPAQTCWSVSPSPKHSTRRARWYRCRRSPADP